MHDDEYNASIEWCIEIGTQGRCMWVRVRERGSERGRDIIIHHNLRPAAHMNPQEHPQTQRMTPLSSKQVGRVIFWEEMKENKGTATAD